ncbi:coagulation factor IIIa [Esox lucius]|uniref:Tissue factor n=1 Tax=Esox lucius TaxID=8010 RepID=A0A3P8ZCH5_ESOLU|nr:coagulation factor IIIa [Esox lucius]
MLKMEWIFFLTTLCSVLFTFCHADTYPKAQNVSWNSVNFKTLLTWDPIPVNYSYTVEYSIVGQNRERNPHCIRTMRTECDLSNSLVDLKAKYSADVLSEPKYGETSDLVEFPHTSSDWFTPYTDTVIGRPDFKIEVSKDKKKITLYVEDPPTALFKKNEPKTIRDVFGDDLQYKVTFGKSASTGKKTKISASSEILLDGKDIDPGVSYCFNVQAYIPSRSPDKQLGESSKRQCSSSDKSFIEDFGVGAIAGFILLLILTVVIVIVTVVCCRRKTKANMGKERVPLRDV